MNEYILFLLQHGYAVLFVWVLADQIGLPLPAFPLLLAAGALAGAGQLNLFGITLLATVASFLGNVVWYEIGRRRGGTVLNLLCRISFEPDTCVRRTKSMFARHGKSSLLVSKFVPGLNTVAAPVAGVFEMPRPSFLLLNGIGAFLWAGSFIGLGYLFSSQLEQVWKLALPWGSWLMVLLVAVLAAYVGFKYLWRRRFLRLLRIGRISPEELKQKLDVGEDVVIVDLRHPLDFQTEPRMLPGAIRLAPEELEQRHHEIPRDRDVILYCT